MGIWHWIVETAADLPGAGDFPRAGDRLLDRSRRRSRASALGSVTATLLAAVVIGQIGIEIPGPIKSTFFMLFLFAVGYGVGPQFFRGLSKDGPKQILFSVIVLALCLLVPVVCARMAGLDVGYAVGMYAGSQTISASIGVATDQINRLGAAAGAGQGMARRHPGRVRRDLHLRHHRFGHRACAARSEADRHRPPGGLRRIREAAGRR